MPFISKIDCFKMRVSVIDENSSNELHQKVIYQTTLPQIYGLHPLTMEADPFLFVYNDILYLFYEELRYGKVGKLRMISTSDLMNWSSPVTVLSESFHLSFPNVFEYEGDVYMIPETGSIHEIRLYKAIDNTLSRFEYYSTLLKRNDINGFIFDFADSTIVFKDDNFYLFTTINRGDGNCLELYCSDKLNGEYLPHPLSPICINQKYGRNAGCLLDKGGRMYRVAQDCCKGYGDNVHILSVNQLDNTVYEETPYKNYILDTKVDFYRNGGHQFSEVRYKGLICRATDAKEPRLLLIPRLLNHLFH